RELGGLVDPTAAVASSHVVRDLIARLIGPRGAESQFVGGRGVTRSSLHLLLVRGQRILKRLRLHELLDGYAVGGEVVLPAPDDEGYLLALAAQQCAEDLLHPLALEQFETARAQSRALDRQLALGIDERVVLHLVAEHRRVAPVELEQDRGGK